MVSALLRISTAWSSFFGSSRSCKVLIDFSAASVKPWKMMWDFEADRACWRSCSMRSS